jgi:hypothetical protein
MIKNCNYFAQFTIKTVNLKKKKKEIIIFFIRFQEKGGGGKPEPELHKMISSTTMTVNIVM